MSYTKGPWSVGRWNEHSNGYAIDSPYCSNIGTAHYLGGTAQAKVNAQLMAAAPALLEAAEKSLKLLEKGAPGWGVAKDLLRAAIHEATHRG